MNIRLIVTRGLAIALIFIGVLWVGHDQIEIKARPFALASNTIDPIPDGQTFTKDDIRMHTYAFAHQIENESPIILFPAIPLSIGFFLLGRYLKK